MKNMIITVLLAVLVAGCASGRHHKLYEGDQMAQIQSYDTVLIKYIDDEDMGIGFIGQKHTYDIKAGQRVLLVEYSDIFSVDADQHEKVVSRPAKITFIAEVGKQYQVRHPPQQRLNNAKAFAEKPEFWVVELPSGNRVASQVELSRPRSFLPALKFENTSQYEFASDAVNASPGAAATGATAAAVSGVQSGELSNLKMLQYSWKNASEQERAAFLEWIKQK